MPLNELANLAGLEPEYWDLAGGVHVCSSETARSLLLALGIAARTESDIHASLQSLADEAWQEAVPPVITGVEGCEINVGIRLPMARSSQSLGWSIALENGKCISGTCRIEEMRIEDSRAVRGEELALRILVLAAQPCGYHRLRIDEPGEGETMLVVAPRRAFLPSNFFDRRRFGISAQLYAVRSGFNWGIGDFSDLRKLIDWSVRCGAGMVGINPLHALFLDDPAGASPYSPSSRLFLNPLALDVTAADGFAAETPDSSALEKARAGNLIDYNAVAAAKLGALNAAFRRFTASLGDGQRQADFRSFVEAGGAELRKFTIFQVLSEHFGSHDWSRWPEPYRRPDAREVEALVQSCGDRHLFFAYLQWQCEIQLAESSRKGSGESALYRDLAVGADAASADSWTHQDLFAAGARVGAPPDPFNETGQEWGLVPMIPRRLRAQRYAHFISLLRANMRNACALRIDHIMGWQRLFVIPAGASAGEGTYLRYPIDDLLSIARLESHRHRCMLIGEDLGTVPFGFRERLADENVLSFRVLYFEKEHGRFKSPSEYPACAAASVSTHDLATLRGFWLAADIDEKARAGVYAREGEEARAREERESDKLALLDVLLQEGLLTGSPSANMPWSGHLADAVHLYLARSAAGLCMIQLDDLAAEIQQANLPGNNSYPSWRRRLELTLEAICGDPAIVASLSTIGRERNRQ